MFLKSAFSERKNPSPSPGTIVPLNGRHRSAAVTHQCHGMLHAARRFCSCLKGGAEALMQRPPNPMYRQRRVHGSHRHGRPTPIRCIVLCDLVRDVWLPDSTRRPEVSLWHGFNVQSSQALSVLRGRVCRSRTMCGRRTRRRYGELLALRCWL